MGDMLLLDTVVFLAMVFLDTVFLDVVLFLGMVLFLDTVFLDTVFLDTVFLDTVFLDMVFLGTVYYILYINNGLYICVQVNLKNDNSFVILLDTNEIYYSCLHSIYFRIIKL